MTVYLTSSPGGVIFSEQGVQAAPLDTANGFAANLKRDLPAMARGLLLSADPENYAGNDRMAQTMLEAFAMSGLSVAALDVCDDRNTAWDLNRYALLILSGGHVPTQNRFFRRIGLRARIAGFGGVVLGISAGTMNSAAVVYAQPELDGESADPAYERFLAGLGLTGLMLLPHYQMTKDTMLDGKRLFEDITYPDSIGRVFYALPDGSYVRIANGASILHGPAYRIADGTAAMLCGPDKTLAL